MRLHRRLQECRAPLLAWLPPGTVGRGTWRDPFLTPSAASHDGITPWHPRTVDCPGWLRVGVSAANGAYVPAIPELVVAFVDPPSPHSRSVFVHALATLGVPGAALRLAATISGVGLELETDADAARRRILTRRLRTCVRTLRGFDALEAARMTGGLSAVRALLEALSPCRVPLEASPTVPSPAPTTSTT